MKKANRPKNRVNLSKGKIIAVSLAMMMAVSFLPITYAFADTPEDETADEAFVTTGIALTLAETAEDQEASDEETEADVQEEDQETPIEEAEVYSQPADDYVPATYGPDVPPAPTVPGNSLVLNEDGTYTEYDDRGLNVVLWTWDTDIEEWTSVPLTVWTYTTVDDYWEFNDVPATADNTDLFLRAAMFGASAFGLAALIIALKKSVKTKKIRSMMSNRLP